MYCLWHLIWKELINKEEYEVCSKEEKEEYKEEDSLKRDIK